VRPRDLAKHREEKAKIKSNWEVLAVPHTLADKAIGLKSKKVKKKKK
jgi:hypothetical protein